jgi:hypothetical protein
MMLRQSRGDREGHFQVHALRLLPGSWIIAAALASVLTPLVCRGADWQKNSQRGNFTHWAMISTPCLGPRRAVWRLLRSRLFGP